MGMPHKGSRKVEIEGEKYLWRVRGDVFGRPSAYTPLWETRMKGVKVTIQEW